MHRLFFNDQFPITAIREIRLLTRFNHENIVSLKEIVTSIGKRWRIGLVGGGGKGCVLTGGGDGHGLCLVTEGEDDVPTSIFMVFEYCDGDLSDLLKQNFRLTPDHIKCFTKQVIGEA